MTQWRVQWFDRLDSKDWTSEDIPDREAALTQACALRAQPGKTEIRIIDPTGLQVPDWEINAFYEINSK
jgi:hypothetical protein